MNDNQNGWNEYSKLVLKELTTLASSIQSLNTEIQELKQEITRMREREDRVDDIKAWKEKIDEVVSPTQLQGYVKDIEDLRAFKTKAITVFAIVQFLMAAAVSASKIF